MSDSIIKVKNVSKSFVISHQSNDRYLSLRDVISGSLKKALSKRKSTFTEEFWALKDLNFEIKRGDRVGIIGRNGAGKSTLLKILSRITEPSSGRIDIEGRVASLLEVGTGFHPELTGRENIFLNGAILGMSRSEIRKKFDEIVSFAEVEKFLDTPVKRYSSGMYVRLAFAVAAHLEPEILIVDEVLAVGDVAFQKKCLGKMEDVSAKEGRTVLFVSHNMASIQKLCNRGIFLENGSVRQIDLIDQVVTSYLNMNNSLDEAAVDLTLYKQRKGSGLVVFEKILISNDQGEACNKFSLGNNMTLTLHLKSEEKVKNFRIAVQLYEKDGTPIANMIDVDSGFEVQEIDGKAIVSLTLKDMRFYPETYGIGLYLGSSSYSEIYDHIERCISFAIINDGELTARPLSRPAGLLFLTPHWKLDSTA